MAPDGTLTVTTPSGVTRVTRPPGLDDPALSDDALLDAMLAHPILINRPFVFTERGVRLCRPSELVLDILSHPQRGAFTKEDGEPVVDTAGQRVTGALA